MTAEQVPLTPHGQEFVATVLGESEDLKDAAEVVDFALRLLEQERDAKLATLRAEVQKGFDDIDAGRDVDVAAEDLHDFIAGLGRRAVERVDAENAR